MIRFIAFLLVALLLGAGAAWWWQVNESAELAENGAGYATVIQRSDLQVQDHHKQLSEPVGILSAADLRPELVEWNRQGLDALQQEDPQAAVGFFAAALEIEADNKTLRSNLAGALVAWAVQLQAQGDLQRAFEVLERAFALHADRAGPTYWLAHLHMRNGDREAAKSYLDQARELGLEFVSLLRMRADIAAVEGELDLSVALIEQALQLEPENSTIQDRAEQLQAERLAFQTFLTDATAHFDSRYDPQVSALVDSLTDLNRDLEDAWQDVVSILGVQPQDRLLVIWLDADSYRWQAPTWSAALFDGRVRIVIDDYDQQKNTIRRTLRHELTHAVLHTTGMNLPTWLHEGLAQSAEGSDPNLAIKRFAATPPKLSLEQLDGNWTTWTDRDQVTEAYAYALAFCAWLRAEYGESVMANLFLNLQGRSFADAWLLTFGLDLNAADATFRESLKRL